MTAKKTPGRARSAGTTGTVTDGAVAVAATTGTPTPPSEDPDAIRADIAATRAELGDSVEALAAKANVKARAKRTVASAKDRAKNDVKDRAALAGQVATRRVKETAQQVGATAQRVGATAQRVGATVRQRPAPLAGVIGGLFAAAGVVGAVVMVRRRRAAKARAHGWRRWARWSR